MIGVTVVTDPATARTPLRTRLTTPVRLRLWTGAVVFTALLVLVLTTLVMSRLTDEVQVIGSEAAPQAATASDLYFALSDLDAQTARLVMIDNADALSANQLDALRTYQQRSVQIDADLERALTTASTERARATVRDLLNQLAIYRQLTGQALAAEHESPPQPLGSPPPSALGYYAHATNVLHFQLLPIATTLRTDSQARLADAYAAEHRTAVGGIVLLVVCGAVLVILLALLQLRLVRHFRRLLNPALLVATLAAVGVVAAACFVLLDDTDRLNTAQRDDFAPYLALTQAQAVSYDAAADTSRYVLSANLPYFQEDFRRKSGCLVNGGACAPDGDALSGGLAVLAAGPDTTDAQVRAVLDRWTAYERDHNGIVTLARSGQVDSAINTLTGFRRGDAAFDFVYYDAAISDIAAGRKQAFDAALADARDELSGWTIIPTVIMGTAILLVLFGMRRRLAEYR